MNDPKAAAAFAFLILFFATTLVMGILIGLHAFALALALFTGVLVGLVMAASVKAVTS